MRTGSHPAYMMRRNVNPDSSQEGTGMAKPAMKNTAISTKNCIKKDRPVQIGLYDIFSPYYYNRKSYALLCPLI